MRGTKASAQLRKTGCGCKSQIPYKSKTFTTPGPPWFYYFPFSSQSTTRLLDHWVPPASYISLSPLLAFSVMHGGGLKPCPPYTPRVTCSRQAKLRHACSEYHRTSRSCSQHGSQGTKWCRFVHSCYNPMVAQSLSTIPKQL